MAKFFNAAAVRAAELDASDPGDTCASMGQGKLSRTAPPRFPTDAMGQGKVPGNFKGGDTGTFMGQSSSGGHIPKP
jgi:hypothetical protein